MRLPDHAKPVDPKDLDRYRMAVREKVIEPMLSRKLKRLLDEADARRRPLKELIRIQHKALRLPQRA